MSDFNQRLPLHVGEKKHKEQTTIYDHFGNFICEVNPKGVSERLALKKEMALTLVERLNASSTSEKVMKALKGAQNYIERCGFCHDQTERLEEIRDALKELKGGVE